MTTTSRRRLLIFASVVAPLAASAQATTAPRETLPIDHSIAIDLRAALDQRWRIAVEPLVFGRFSFGLSGALTTTPDDEPYYSVPVLEGGIGPVIDFAPCLPDGGCPPPIEVARRRYRATTLSLHTRWYPEFLSRRSDDQGYAVYVGEFLSLQERRINWPEYIQPPIGYPTEPPSMPATDSIIIIPDPYPNPYPRPYPSPSSSQRLRRLEPGAELGVRVMLGRRMLLDVGGIVRFVRIDDPMSARRPGDVESRLVTMLGVSW